MKKQCLKIALAATFVLAMAFALSCSKDDEAGGNKPDNSSSEIMSSSSGGSSTSVSSSSKIAGIGVGCEDIVFNPSDNFCYEGKIYDKCNGIEYNPSTHICKDLIAYPVSSSSVIGCEDIVFNPLDNFCYEGKIYDKCNGMEYNPSTHICDGSIASPAKCDGISYNPLEYKCEDNVIKTECGDRWYDASLYKCETDNKIYLKTPVSYGGKNYEAVLIGTQTWMTENLNYNVDGSKCYDNDPANCDKYGRLYNWAMAMTVCPTGWHLPSSNEWSKLFSNNTYTSYNFKAASGWEEYDNNNAGKDVYGFSALPGGGCVDSFGDPDACHFATGRAFWWGSNNSSDYSGSRICLGSWHESCNTHSYSTYKTDFLSVRCVKD